MSSLELKGIHKRFAGLQAVKDVSFSIQEGQIFGLIGPNGAGKTTLFNLITGFFHPDSGEIYYDKQPLHSLPPYSIARLGIARTFQIVKPFGTMTVEENVMVGAYIKAHKREGSRLSGEVLKFLGLGAKQHHQGKSLTLLEKKRLELARALATQPKLLMLDEVLAGLNASETDELVGLLKQIRERKTTIFFIEHNMRAAMALAEKIIVLDHGEKIAEGPPEEIANNPAVIQAYLGKGYRSDLA